jgi:hypothetical protein
MLSEISNKTPIFRHQQTNLKNSFQKHKRKQKIKSEFFELGCFSPPVVPFLRFM